MADSILKIFNGRIITPDKTISSGTVIVRDGKIEEVTDKRVDVAGATEIDAQGKYITPGFVDIHVHGGAGHDFMDGTVDAFLAIANLHAMHGTTSMWPTSLSASPEELDATLNSYEGAHAKNKNGAQFLGMHLEGPYFAMTQRGAQDPRFIRDPDPVEYIKVLERAPFVKRWSAAPELNGAMAFGDYMKSHGVLPAIAHTDALYDDVAEAVKHGYSLSTHLYSGMSGVTRKNAFRYAGVIESSLLLDELDVEIITDGTHLPPPLLQLVHKVKGPDKTALITDAMRAAGMPPGKSMLGSLHNGLEVIVEDDVAKLPDRSSFAGSVATADRLVRTMTAKAGISMIDTIKMITATPARIAGASSKGSLVRGKDADIVIFDDDIVIHHTIIGGRVVYSKR